MMLQDTPTTALSSHDFHSNAVASNTQSNVE